MELGRLPIKLNIIKAMLKFWFRLVTLPQNRLVSQCYWTLQNITNFHDTWLDSIKNIIDSSGFSHIWANQKQLHQLDPHAISQVVNSIMKSLECQFLQNANSEVKEQTKLHLFSNITSSLKPAPYLTKA